MTYIIIVILLFNWLIYRFIAKTKHQRDIVYLSLFVIIGIIIGFRDYTVGADTITYYNIFNNISSNSLIYAFENIREEWGYVLCNKIIALLGGNYYCFQLIYSIVMLMLIGKFIIDNTTNYYMAVIIFLGAGYFEFSYNIIRQMMAISIGACGWTLWRQQKYKKALLILLIATSFHKLAALLILAYLIYSIRDKKLLVAIITILCLSLEELIPFAYSILESVGMYVNYFKATSDHISRNGIFILWTFEGVLILFSYISSNINSKGRCVAILSILNLIFNILDEQIRYLDRVGLFFFPFMILLFCVNGDNLFKEQNLKNIYRVAVSLFFIAFFIYRETLSDYKTYLYDFV